MTSSLLPFPTTDLIAPAPRTAFDPGYAALGLLTRLRDAFTASARLIAECRKRHARTTGRWGVPDDLSGTVAHCRIVAGGTHKRP